MNLQKSHAIPARNRTLPQALIAWGQATGCQVREHGKSFTFLILCNIDAANSVLGFQKKTKNTLWFVNTLQLLGSAYNFKLEIVL